jgi:hypothetical protein
LPEPKIEISVVHASLEYAQYPVMVGHFEGATLKGAEAFVDARLDGLLSKRQMIGQYPQAAGEAVFLPPRRRTSASGDAEHDHTFPPGAYVLGLGPPGELTHNTLAQSVRAALVERGIDLYERGDTPGELVEFGVASVLIGAFPIDGLTVEASLVAIVEGLLAANDTFRRFEAAANEAQRPTPRVRVTALEVIERYADRAELAGHAVRLLPHLLDRVEDLNDVIERTDVVVEARAGGLPYRPALEEAEASWRRVMITVGDPPRDQVGADVGVGSSTLGLDVTVLSRLARADRLHHVVDCRTVDNLVAAAIAESSPDAQVSNTLWELLLPVELKDGVIGAGRIQLVVDERTANYPWEVMTSRGLPGVDTPLSLARAGLLRQFREGSGGQRFRARRALADRVLVIGNPPALPADYPWMTDRYQSLPGATAEARRVRDVLTKGRFSVTSLIWDAGAYEGGASPDLDRDASANSGRAVINALFRDDYRIVHVAAHGTVGDDPADSGAVIGGGMFLTANVVRQLAVVPDIVFLNCCHLAKVGFNRLAAGVARQLLNIGVQVVVAAGWAVDDRAAEAFAAAFYESLLAGRDFGDAVGEARTAAHDKPSLTWGAYQCYGDPGYRLTLRGGSTAGSSLAPVSRDGLIREVRSVAVRAADVGRPDTGELERRRVGLVEDLRNLQGGARLEWLARDDVSFELGKAYAELGLNDEAVHWYRIALDAGASHPAVLYEQLANREIRLAQELADGRRSRSDARVADAPDELVEQARQHLQEASSLRPTSERTAIQASLDKKAATLTTDMAERGKLVRSSAAAYRAAHELNMKAAADDPRAKRNHYPVLNWLQMESLVSSWPPVDTAGLDQLTEACRWLDEHTDGAQRPRREDCRITPDFWTLAREGDVALTRMLLDPDVDGVAGAIEVVADAYLRAFGIRSSWGNRASVLDHLRDLRTLAEGSPALVEAVSEVIDRLDRWEDENIASASDRAKRTSP